MTKPSSKMVARAGRQMPAVVAGPTPKPSPASAVLDLAIAQRGGVKCYLIDPDSRTIVEAGLADLEGALLTALSTDTSSALAFNAVRIPGEHILVVSDDFIARGATPFRHAGTANHLGGRALVFARVGPDWVSPTTPIEDVASALSSCGARFTVGVAGTELIGDAKGEAEQKPISRRLPPFSFFGEMAPADDGKGPTERTLPPFSFFGECAPAPEERAEPPVPFSFSQLFRPKERSAAPPKPRV